jgi:hypothetical protein
MKSLLQGPLAKPQEARDGVAGPLCPECLQPFPHAHPGQLFCSPAHRDAWNNRATVHGRVLTPLAMVERVTRGGSRGDTATGIRARQQKDQLIQRWVEEDRAAGRMDWPTYLRLRYGVGFDPLG